MELPFGYAEFDLTCCHRVLHHVRLPVLAVSELARVTRPGGKLFIADQLGMPLAHDEAHGLWALGPRSGDRHVLDSTQMPELVLQDFDGGAFDLASVRGRKVVLMAWASW